MEPCVSWIYLTCCMEYVWTSSLWNRCISKSYTTSKNTIVRQYTEKGAAVVSTITSHVQMIMFTGLLAWKVCNKPKSPPAWLLFKGLGTEHTTVKFGGVARSHTRATREKRCECEGREKKLPRNSAAECRQIKFFFLEIGQSNPPLFSYTVSNGIKPLWDETANSELIIFFT